MKARAQLMRVLQKTVRSWELSQKVSANRLGVTQPRLNDLLQGKIENSVWTPCSILQGAPGSKFALDFAKRPDGAVGQDRQPRAESIPANTSGMEAKGE